MLSGADQFCEIQLEKKFLLTDCTGSSSNELLHSACTCAILLLKPDHTHLSARTMPIFFKRNAWFLTASTRTVCTRFFGPCKRERFLRLNAKFFVMLFKDTIVCIALTQHFWSCIFCYVFLDERFRRVNMTFLNV